MKCTMHPVADEVAGYQHDRDLRADVIARVRAILELLQIAVPDLDLAAFTVVRILDGLVQTAVLDRPALLSDERFATSIMVAVTRYLGIDAVEGRI